MQVKRFHRRATAFLASSDDGDLTTYGEFLDREGFSEHFVTHYAVPVVSCVWSSGRAAALPTRRATCSGFLTTTPC